MPGPDFSLLARGGPMMLVLAGLAVLGVMVFVERLLFLHRGQIRAREFLEGIRNILAKRRLVEALTVCEETPGPVAAVVKVALLHAGEAEDKLRFRVQEAALLELPLLERRIGALGAIAQVAPLVGILGTVLGMAGTFQAFEQGGNYAMAAGLSRGMWQALLATGGGLLVGIPALLAHHFLAARVRAITHDLEWSGNEILRYLVTEYQGAGVAAGATGEGSR
jgi:biopolymer transport protein ExbB